MDVTLALVPLEAGLTALQQSRHQEAISLLEAYCRDCVVNAQFTSRDYLRAQMHLIDAYEQTGQSKRAQRLCQQLTTCANAQVQIWAQQRLKALAASKLALAESNAAAKLSVFDRLKQIL